MNYIVGLIYPIILPAATTKGVLKKNYSKTVYSVKQMTKSVAEGTEKFFVKDYQKSQ